MKKIYFTILCVVFGLTMMQAQRTVTGQVAGSDGTPLIGVNVSEQGTSTGTVTDIDGNFSISVNDGASLIISYLGYTTQTVAVGNQSNMNVVLDEGVALDEVVVTALGIKREAATLTYAQQTVEGDELTLARDISFLNSLSGKAAGVEIQKSSGGAGGSTRVVLRGDKSLSGSSEPLFVIDGIPMANNKGSQGGMWDGVDGGDGMSQLNPDDIASISVLKGSNAAALYGSQGANGVVLITTKQGESGKAKVSVNSGVTFESRMIKPDLQFRYGSVNGTKESWATSTGNFEDGYVDDFFKTGVNLMNSVSISGGNDRTRAYFSYGNVNATGIIDKHTYGRNNVTFKQSTKLLDDRLTIGSNVMLSSEKTNNRPRAGYYDNPLGGLYRFPRDRNFEDLKTNYSITDPNNNLAGQNWFVIDHHQSNPYWLLNEESQVHENKRMIGSLTLDYKLSDKLSVSARGNYDYADKLAEEQQRAGGNTTTVHPNGSWTYAKWNDELIYTDAILKYDDNFSEDFSLGVIAGTSYQKTVFRQGVSVPGSAQFGLQYANEFYFQNIGTNVPVSSTLGSRLIKQAVFTNATVGYKDMAFLDLSGRNDWASSLSGTGNESYFYPSIGATAILSKMMNMPEAISFAKVRFSRSRVGNEVPFNVVDPENTIAASGGINRNLQQPFDNLSPEIITSNEIGANVRFLDDRVGFDVTYYNTVSTDQFVRLPAPSGSGFSTYFVNVGKIVNKGFEVVVDMTPIYTPSFTWNTALNFWSNTNEVVETHPDLASTSTGSSEGYRARFEEGGSVGDVYVFKFQRDAQDRIMLDEASGRPLRSANDELAGNLNPNWSLGWNNNLKMGNLSLNFIINGKFGGLAFSQTESMLDEAGVSERTAAARDAGGFAVDAVQGGTAVSSVDPELWFKTVGGRNGIGENYLYDRTNVRLTQASLGYQTAISDVPVTFSLVGQNLFFLYIKAPFDPELAINTTRNSPSLDNFNLPATRTIGFNVNVNF